MRCIASKSFFRTSGCSSLSSSFGATSFFSDMSRDRGVVIKEPGTGPAKTELAELIRTRDMISKKAFDVVV